MVLKKPYAFLIKHFKLIHLLLCIPIAYLIVRTGSIANFLTTYVNANYYTNQTNLAGVYINYFMYLAVLLIILLTLAIYFLMRQKQKDTKFYMFLIVYYVFLLVVITFCHSILGSIEEAAISAQSVRLYRDIAYIIYIPQFFFLGYSALRGIGFDIKKFNFDEDAKELEITDFDNEEFELEFGRDSYKYKRKIRRFIREFRYYVLENKFTFGVLLSLIVIAIGTMLYLNFGVYNKTYRETQNMTHNHLSVKVMDSVLTNLDVGGKEIDAGKYYLALSLKLKNTSKEYVSLDYENFQLEVAKRRISATLDRGSYFPDLGIAYTRDTKIAPGEENVYVLTYEIDAAFIHQTIELKILDSLTYEIGSVTPIYKTVHLSYEKVFENKAARDIAFGKILELSSTRLSLTQLQIQDYQITKSYEYSYQNCTYGSCQTLKNKVSANDSNKNLLVLKRMFTIDNYTNYYRARKGSGSFVSDFLTIYYRIGASETTTNVINVTPKELEDTWVFEVPVRLEDADYIDILFTYRGFVYRMHLKE